MSLMTIFSLNSLFIIGYLCRFFLESHGQETKGYVIFYLMPTLFLSIFSKLILFSQNDSRSLFSNVIIITLSSIVGFTAVWFTFDIFILHSGF